MGACSLLALASSCFLFSPLLILSGSLLSRVSEKVDEYFFVVIISFPHGLLSLGGPVGLPQRSGTAVPPPAAASAARAPSSLER